MAAGGHWLDLDLAVWVIPEKTDQCVSERSTPLRESGLVLRWQVGGDAFRL